MNPYLTIAQEARFELVVKKSRFIAVLCPVENPDAAAQKVATVKKSHWDARHHCTAMIIGEDGAFRRFSDDGEPQGTAGLPMLEVLAQNVLTNVLAVVTRYFGGILLGAGGLNRAYSSSVAGAVKSAQIIRMVPCEVYALTLPYASYGNLETLARQGGYVLENPVFEEEVAADIVVPLAETKTFLARTAETFMGKAHPVRKGVKYKRQDIKPEKFC